MSPRAIVGSLVGSLGGDCDRWATESTPPPPTSVAETFVMVVVGFGRVWAAIWRLPAMVGVVDVSFVGILCVRGERNKIRAPKFPSRAPGDTIFGARDRGTMSVACRHLACRREMSKNVVSS